MVYICVICMVKQYPLWCLSADQRRLLEAIVAPVINIAELQRCILLLCKDCNQLITTVLKFQQTALIGVKNLLSLYKKLKRVKVNKPTRLETMPIKEKAKAMALPVYVIRRNDSTIEGYLKADAAAPALIKKVPDMTPPACKQVMDWTESPYGEIPMPVPFKEEPPDMTPAVNEEIVDLTESDAENEMPMPFKEEPPDMTRAAEEIVDLTESTEGEIAIPMPIKDEPPGMTFAARDEVVDLTESPNIEGAMPIKEEPIDFSFATNVEQLMTGFSNLHSLTEELDIKFEPEFECESQIESECERDSESTLTCKSDYGNFDYCLDNVVERPDIRSLKNNVGKPLKPIDSECDRDSESTLTCESDYGDDYFLDNVVDRPVLRSLKKNAVEKPLKSKPRGGGAARGRGAARGGGRGSARGRGRGAARGGGRGSARGRGRSAARGGGRGSARARSRVAARGGGRDAARGVRGRSARRGRVGKRGRHDPKRTSHIYGICRQRPSALSLSKHLSEYLSHWHRISRQNSIGSELDIDRHEYIAGVSKTDSASYKLKANNTIKRKNWDSALSAVSARSKESRNDASLKFRQTKHLVKQKVKCPMCRTWFGDVGALRRHAWTHIVETPSQILRSAC